MTGVKQSACTLAQSLELSGLNSDELLTRFNSNQSEIARLEIENKLLVSLVRANGFLIRDTNSAAREVAAWVELVIPDGAVDESALTVDELKAGGWWCGDVSGECAAAFESKSINAYNSEAWGTARSGWVGCLFSGGEVTRTMSIEGGERQIHRIGNEFYWGASE